MAPNQTQITEIRNLNDRHDLKQRHESERIPRHSALKSKTKGAFGKSRNPRKSFGEIKRLKRLQPA